MRYYLHLGWVYWKMHLKKTWMFKSSFIINRVVQLLNYFVDFALIWIMVSAFNAVGGWNAYEVMLLYSMNLIGYSLGAFFLYRTMLNVRTDVQSGAFDDVLTKPVSTLPYLCFQNLNPDYIAHVTLAVVLLCVGFGNLGTHIGIVEILKLLLGFVCGGLVYAGLFLLAIAPIFVLRKAEGLRSVMFFLRDQALYPLSIFPLAIQIIMTVILPYAMIGYFPVQSILGKQDYLFLGSAAPYLAPVISLAFCAIGVWFFRFCLRRYKSTGS
jgi:ABC-2 type transport system permease protein